MKKGSHPSPEVQPASSPPWGFYSGLRKKVQVINLCTLEVHGHSMSKESTGAKKGMWSGSVICPQDSSFQSFQPSVLLSVFHSDGQWYILHYSLNRTRLTDIKGWVLGWLRSASHPERPLYGNLRFFSECVLETMMHGIIWGAEPPIFPDHSAFIGLCWFSLHLLENYWGGSCLTVRTGLVGDTRDDQYSQHTFPPQHTHVQGPLSREELSKQVVGLWPLWSGLRPAPKIEQNCIQIQDFRMICTEHPIILTVLSGFQKSRTSLA